ncbi:hypothetical protein [Salinibacter altiplanensis]|uniref:hypothetical protein n=1 Tax=Salinibacter altiplanensis TaxID=1803181 RepID=UPI001F23C7C5|nr:hypothetical protein [Salinibacter altiplanensis]
MLPVLLLATSCDIREDTSPQSFENPLAEAGTRHNEGLDHALADIKGADEPIRDSKELMNLVETSTREFVRKEGLYTKGFDAVQMGMNVVRDGGSVRRAAARGGKGSSYLLPDSLREKLTAEQKRYLDEIGSVLESEPSKSELDRRLAELERSAQSELSDEKAKAVLVGVAVAGSSHRYWSEHQDEWRQAIISNLPEADSTVVRNGGAATSGATNSPRVETTDDCELESMEEIEHPDGSETIVKHYDCDNPGGGFDGGEVAAADMGAAFGGALTGGAAGAAGAAVAGSGGTAALQVYHRIFRQEDEDEEF